MDFFKNLNEQIRQIPIIGDWLSSTMSKTVILIVLIVIIINKGIRDYLNIDIIGQIISLSGRYLKSIPAIKRRKYFKTTSDEKFMKWEIEVLKKIYGSEHFTDVDEVEYPIHCYSTSNNGIKYPFLNICKENDLINCNIYEEKQDRFQKEYLQILGDTVKRPKLEGYALNELKFDNDNNVTSFTANLCNYGQNLITSHILEYELYKIYLNKRKRKNVLKLEADKILSYLPCRRKIHNNITIDKIITTGINRASLLGVQLLVVFLDSDKKYKMLIMKRSEDVAVRPGYWQFIPSGGFELFELNVNAFTIKNNFDVKKAVFREFAEEVFGEKEYEGNGDGNPVENIFNHDKVRFIIDLIDNGQAHMEFLGSVVDLVGLRHELSFILVIDSLEFSKKEVKRNHEAKDIQRISYKDIKDILSNGEKLNPGSAGLLKLALENNLFKNRMFENE